jgi:hypothetical protein
MNDSPAPPPSGELTAYRPVSGMAVAGLGLAVLFALWVAIAGVIALRSGIPLLMNPASLLLPLAAAVLSLAARLQIVRSEGTRVGLRLAHWGLGLSVVCGLGYGAWRAATELALRNQASEFTEAWLEQVGRGRTNEVEACAAFWLTIDPARRDRTVDLSSPDVRQKLASSPKEFQALRDGLRRRFFWGDRGAKGAWPRFGESDLVQAVRQGGDRVSVESQGVRAWQYLTGAEGGYLVEQHYRLATPEGTFDAVIPVMGKDIDKRHWQVIMSEVRVRPAQPTAFGGMIRELRLDSRRFAAEWASRLKQGPAEEVFLDTLPPAERGPLRDRFGPCMLLSGLTLSAPGLLGVAPLVDHKVARASLLPGYIEHAAGKPIDVQNLTADKKTALPDIVKEARAVFGGSAGSKGFALHVADATTYPLSPWQLDPSELRFFQPFGLTLGGKYSCEGLLEVATSDARLLAKVRQAEQAGAASPEGPRLGRQPSWRIVRMKMEIANVRP